MIAIRKIIPLHNGLSMPAVGLGTASFTNEDSMVHAIVEAGYRHIDTAAIYKNEEAVGRALKRAVQAGVAREDLFVTTKLWHDEWSDPKAALEKSLSKLQLDYVDLYLVHWPMMFFAKTPLHVLWPKMESLVTSGLCKSIGVSNFNMQLMWDLLSYCKIKPVCNQIELNPSCSQQDFVDFLLKQDIVPVGYTPVGRPGGQWEKNGVTDPSLREHPLVKEIASKHNKTPVQVMLNWALVRGTAVIPMSSQALHQIDNISVFDFQLSPEEVAAMAILDNNTRLWHKFEMTDNYEVFV